MNIKSVVFGALIICSAPVFAGQKLTPAQCNDYPFKPLTSEVTHAQLMQELVELESVGYNPAAADNYYPAGLEASEARLQAKYRADCTPG